MILKALALLVLFALGGLVAATAYGFWLSTFSLSQAGDKYDLFVDLVVLLLSILVVVVAIAGWGVREWLRRDLVEKTERAEASLQTVVGGVRDDLGKDALQRTLYMLYKLGRMWSDLADAFEGQAELESQSKWARAQCVETLEEADSFAQELPEGEQDEGFRSLVARVRNNLVFEYAILADEKYKQRAFELSRWLQESIIPEAKDDPSYQETVLRAQFVFAKDEREREAIKRKVVELIQKNDLSFEREEAWRTAYGI